MKTTIVYLFLFFAINPALVIAQNEDVSSYSDISDENEYIDSIALKYKAYTISGAVIKFFLTADWNKDGKLSWVEIQNFQYGMKQKFSYKKNKTALTPDEFFKQGGGDCEDWAIFTCKMLQHFGFVAYIACYGRVTVNKHALCLVKVNGQVPAGFMWYDFKRSSIPDGKYIPIDYEVVGGLSAIDRRWKIARICEPEEMYGRYN